MRGTFDRNVLFGAVLLSILLVVGSIQSYRNTRQLREDARWVAHTHEILDSTAELMLALTLAEAGERGFLLSGEGEYLRPVEAAAGEIEAKVAAWKSKARDDDLQQNRIGELEKLIAERLALMKSNIARKSRGEAAPLLVAGAGKGRESTGAIRRLVTEIKLGENALLAERERRTDIAYRTAVVSGLVSAALGLAMLLLLVWLHTRSLGARKENSESIRASERRYRALVETTPQVVWSIGGKDERAKAWWSELTGQPAAESEGLGWLDAVHPEDRDRVRETWAHAFRVHSLYDTEYRIRTRSGEYRHFVVRGVSLGGESGGAGEWIGTLTDTTEKKSAEIALRNSEVRLRQLADSMPQIVWASGPDGTIDYYNRRWYELTDAAGAAAGDQSSLPILHPEDRRKCRDLWGEAVRTGQPYQIEYRFQFPGADHYRWHLGRALPVRSGAGEIIRWYGTSTDIHEQKRAEYELRDLNATLEMRVEERSFALRKSEERFRAIFHSQFQFIGLLSPAGVVLEANRTALKATGATEEEVLGKPFWETRWWTHDALQQERLREAVGKAANGIPDRFEASHPAPDGTLMWVDFSVTPFFDDAGDVILLIPEGREISARKRAEEALRIQEEKFRSAFEHAPIGMALIAPNGAWLRVNQAICDIVGYPERELLAMDFQSITHPDDLGADLASVAAMLEGTIRTYRMEKRYFHSSGRTVQILLSVSLVRDGAGAPLYFISQIEDITQRKEAEERIRVSLREKEVMLKEIHHRVKNNLQIVSTLLDLQSGHTLDPQSIEMFRESRSRVRSMALIHERLYRSEDLAKVDFVDYVSQLADDLFEAYRVSDGAIAVRVDVDVPPLPIDIAIPCGLLLNELMSNCLKHAYPESAGGVIRVSLKRNERGENVLTVADDGAGFPGDLDFRNATSFGLQLMHTLVEQLNGEIALKSRGGTEIAVAFPAHR